MKKTLSIDTGLFIAAVAVSFGLAFACKEKPNPTPEPEPTVSAEPTPGQQPGQAVCSRKVAFGGGGGTAMSYECQDAEGTSVTCPSNPEALPNCPE